MNKYILVAVAGIAFGAMVETPKNYQLDLFSLISFSLAVAALILSVFMGWLSWEFYKKTKEASDQSQLATVKIETAVLNIQSEITEIVRRAVGYWTQDENSAEAIDLNSVLTAKIEELFSQVQSLTSVNPSQEDLWVKLTELVRLQKDQIANLTSSVVDAKAKAIFPSIDRGPVAQVTQSVSTNTPSNKSGELIINVIRSSKVATVTGKFTPSFSTIPTLNVELIGSPNSDTSKIALNSGV